MAAMNNLQHLPDTTVMQLLEKAFQQQWELAERIGEPRDPALQLVQHRPDALGRQLQQVVQVHGRQPAGMLLAHATFRTFRTQSTA